MNKDNYSEYIEKSEMLKVLAHPIRLCIVKGLLAKGACNVSYMQSCLEVPQPTLSQHIQKLKAAGIITGKRNGTEICYQVCNQNAAKLIQILFSDSWEP